MSLTIEDKIRLLAAQDPTLQGYLGTSPFRCFDRQLPPNMINQGACVTVRRVSTVRNYYMAGFSGSSLQSLEMPRVQFNVYTWTGPSNARIMANAPDTARQVRGALINWLSTVACFSSSAQFDSPATSPPNHPNFVLNEISSLNYDLDPPGYLEIIEVRIMNLDN